MVKVQFVTISDMIHPAINARRDSIFEHTTGCRQTKKKQWTNLVLVGHAVVHQQMQRQVNAFNLGKLCAVWILVFWMSNIHRQWPQSRRQANVPHPCQQHLPTFSHPGRYYTVSLYSQPASIVVSNSTNPRTLALHDGVVQRLVTIRR